MLARTSRRRVLAIGAGALLAAPAILRPARGQGRAVYVNSYGGVWESAWRKAFFEPFTAQTGIAIKTVPGVSFAKLKAQVQTRNFEWDVVNLGDVEYGQAVLEGLLEKVDREAAKADQLPAHMVRDYGITSIRSAPIWPTARTSFRTAGRKAGPTSGTSRNSPAAVASTTARSAASRSRCWPMACLPTSSIPWTSTAPSAR